MLIGSVCHVTATQLGIICVGSERMLESLLFAESGSSTGTESSSDDDNDEDQSSSEEETTLNQNKSKKGEEMNLLDLDDCERCFQAVARGIPRCENNRAYHLQLPRATQSVLLQLIWWPLCWPLTCRGFPWPQTQSLWTAGQRGSRRSTNCSTELPARAYQPFTGSASNGD